MLQGEGVERVGEEGEQVMAIQPGGGGVIMAADQLSRAGGSWRQAHPHKVHDRVADSTHNQGHEGVL